MPTCKPARKALPSARPASDSTASGGNDRSTMPSSADAQPRAGRGDIGDPVQQSSASRQRSTSTSSDGSSHNMNDDLVVISSTNEHTSALTTGARNESQVPKLTKGASAPSSSRKRDHDNMANASAHVNDTGAVIAAQASGANQARTGDASFPPTKYQRILPRESGGGAWLPPLAPGLSPPREDDDLEKLQKYVQFLELQLWMAQGKPGLPSQMNNSESGNQTLPRPVHGGGQPLVGPSNVNFPAPVGYFVQRQTGDASNPAAQPADPPLNNPGPNAASMPAGHRDASISGPATFGQAQDLPEELSAQINGLISLSNRNERARQQRSQTDNLLLSYQVDAHSRQIEAFQRTFKDLQAGHVRDEAARSEEMKKLYDLFAKKQQELSKKVEEPTRQNQRKRGGPSSRD